jgi:hypothetical protein
MEPCPRVEFDASGDESWDHSVFPVSESEHVFDEMHEGHVICLLESESSDASDDGGCNTNQFFREGWDWEVSLSNVMGQIGSLLQGFHQQCQEIHANSAMDARQKCQKLQEFKGGLESLKAGIAAPPVQTKAPKVYKMCDCENSIRILQKKYELNVSKKKPERTSVQSRYCECDWAGNGCKKCTELGCGTGVCKKVEHYSVEFRDPHPGFLRRKSGCVSCRPKYFCDKDDHYSAGYILKHGPRLKSACHECKVSRQSTAVASTN